MASLSFAGKLQRLCLSLDLVGAGVAIGIKDRERYIEPLLGPGWEAVARAIVQRAAAPVWLASAFEEVVGGDGVVSEAVLATLHNEACQSGVVLGHFATASSMVRACTVFWAPKGWGLGAEDQFVAGALNDAASRYIAEERPPCGFRAAVDEVAARYGVCRDNEAVGVRLALLSSAYRSVWLRRAVEAALAESGGPKGKSRLRDSQLSLKLRDEAAFVAKTRTLRTSDGVERARRRARLDERIEFYCSVGFDLSGLDEEARRRLVSKGVFARDGKLRLLVDRRLVREAVAIVGPVSDQAPAIVRFLHENRRAIDMPDGECLEELALHSAGDVAIIFNCEALAVAAAGRDANADERAARDLDEVLFETRRAMLRIEPGDAMPEFVAVPA